MYLIKKNITAAFIVISFLSYAQNYKIANWLDDKKCAIVLTFDDWDPSHREASEAMIEKGVTGTFFVTIQNAWRTDDYQMMQSAVDNGIEIANHTVTHPNLETSSQAKLASEIEDCRTTLNTNVNQGRGVHTLAYPLGAFNNNVIAETKKTHIAARTVFLSSNDWGYDYPRTEDEYFKIPTVRIGTFGSTATSSSISNFNNGLDEAEAGGGIYTLMYHSIRPTTWFDPIDVSLFELQLDEVKAREDEDWVTTFSNAVRYHKEQHCASLTTVSNDDDNWVLNLTDTLSNDVIYDQMLTIKLEIPQGETYTSVKQNGEGLTFAINGSKNNLMFNAVPDAGQIVLEKGEPVAVNSIDEQFKAISIYPNPNTGVFSITGLEGLNVSTIQLLDYLGTEIKSYDSKEKIDISDFESGIYMVQFSFEDGSTYSKKVVKE